MNGTATMASVMDQDCRPRVSVLMSFLNARSVLPPTIEALLGQTFPDFELVAVDDGSTDGSAELIRGYGDARLRVVVPPLRLGRTAAINHAIDLARGDLLAVLDADDVPLPDRLAKQVAYMDAHPRTALLGTWWRNLLPDGRLSPVFEMPTDSRSLKDMLSYCNPFVHSSVMFRRADAVAVGGYAPEYEYALDMGLYVSLLEAGDFAMLPEALVHIRILPDSLTRRADYNAARWRDAVRLFTRTNRLAGLSHLARRRGRRQLSRSIIACACAVAGSTPGYALRLLAWAAVRDPLLCLASRPARDAVRTLVAPRRRAPG